MSKFLEFGRCGTFDPINDSDRPKIGDIVPYIPDEGTNATAGAYRVKHVEACLASDLLADIMKGLGKASSEFMSPALFDADECFQRTHADRPFVSWLVWCDLVLEFDKDSVDVDLPK